MVIVIAIVSSFRSFICVRVRVMSILYTFSTELETEDLLKHKYIL